MFRCADVVVFFLFRILLVVLLVGAQLLQAKMDLDMIKNRRDGVKGEARFLGSNLKARTCRVL